MHNPISQITGRSEVIGVKPQSRKPQPALESTSSRPPPLPRRSRGQLLRLECDRLQSNSQPSGLEESVARPARNLVYRAVLAIEPVPRDPLLRQDGRGRCRGSRASVARRAPVLRMPPEVSAYGCCPFSPNDRNGRVASINSRPNERPLPPLIVRSGPIRRLTFTDPQPAGLTL